MGRGGTQKWGGGGKRGGKQKGGGGGVKEWEEIKNKILMVKERIERQIQNAIFQSTDETWWEHVKN